MIPERRKSVQAASNIDEENELKLKTIEEALKPLQEKLQNHKLYKSIETVEDVKKFMSIHFYAVWDFMNLVKRLQNDFTCVTIPFQPTKNDLEKQLRRFINEIVLEEESDEFDGEFISHFEYYFRAMQDLNSGDEFNHNEKFFETLHKSSADFKSPGHFYEYLMNSEFLPDFVQKFLKTTGYHVQDSRVAAVSSFCFGRENAIPLMFTEVLKSKVFKDVPEVAKLKLYMEHHIEMDGDIHSVLSRKIVAHACDSDEHWEFAKTIAENALQARIELWDGILRLIEAK